jgi:hypothetical protein
LIAAIVTIPVLNMKNVLAFFPTISCGLAQLPTIAIVFRCPDDKYKSIFIGYHNYLRKWMGAFWMEGLVG